MAATESWELANWLDRFVPGPDQRQWSWWAGSIESNTRLSITLVAEGWPTAYGAFKWLARASGATRIDEMPGGRNETS